MTMEALFHGERLPTALVSANVRPQLLVEGADVALQVEHFGEGPATAHVGAQEDHTRVSVDALVLLQEPGVTEHFAALITFEDFPVRTTIRVGKSIWEEGSLGPRDPTPDKRKMDGRMDGWMEGWRTKT